MKVSVVIPVYQVENYIRQCLESVRNQSLSDIEILCVNDCGQDASWEIVKEIANQDGRIRLIENEKNLGLAGSRNRGMSFAEGKYIYFLDSDDMIRPDTLLRLYEDAEADDLDVRILGCEFLFEEGVEREKFQGNPSVFKQKYPNVLSGKALYKQWMQVWDWMPSQPRFFYKREFLIKNDIRFLDGILHEDEAFAFDVLMRARRVKVGDERFFIRRFRKDSIMTKRPTARNLIGCAAVLRHILSQREFYCKDSELKSAIEFYRKKIAENMRIKFADAGFTGEFSIYGTTPALSVIIPVYNTEPYLEECLDSILEQDFMDFEIICIDDASSDQSLSVLSRYLKMDPRIRVYCNPANMGQASARNRGLALARGTYVHMCDADDFMEAGAYGVLVAMMEKEHLSAVGFENIQFAQEERFQKQAASPLFSYKNVEGTYRAAEAFATCVEHDVLSPSVPTFLLRREELVRTNLCFDEGILHEDIGFIFSMFMKIKTIRLLHKPFYHRRFRGSSTVTSAFSERNVQGYLKSWEKAFSMYGELTGRYALDDPFWHAYWKWVRDVLGRIRTLYLENEEQLYPDCGVCRDWETWMLYQMLRQTTTGRARARGMLGEQTAKEITAAGKVYVCGTGQYMNRALDAVGAMGVCILGILCEKEFADRTYALRGFPVLSPDEAKDKNVPVLLAVSHYRSEEYRNMLKDAGFSDIRTIGF